MFDTRDPSTHHKESSGWPEVALGSAQGAAAHTLAHSSPASHHCLLGKTRREREAATADKHQKPMRTTVPSTPPVSGSISGLEPTLLQHCSSQHTLYLPSAQWALWEWPGCNEPPVQNETSCTPHHACKGQAAGIATDKITQANTHAHLSPTERLTNVHTRLKLTQKSVGELT